MSRGWTVSVALLPLFLAQAAAQDQAQEPPARQQDPGARTRALEERIAAREAKLDAQAREAPPAPGEELPEERDGRSVLDPELRTSGHYGQEEAAATGGGTAKYGGLLLIVRQDLVSFGGDENSDATLYLAGRVAWWRDQGGSKTGRDQALLDTTITVGLELREHGLLRLEWRRDDSTEDDVCLGRRGLATRDGQDTFAVDMSVFF